MNIKILILGVLILFINACAVQKHSLNYKERFKLLQPIMTKDFEKFDIDAFESEKNTLLASGRETRYNNASKTIKNTLSFDGLTYILKDYDDEHNLIREVRENKQIAIVSDYLDEFMIYGRTFYSNGYIQNKGIGSWLGFAVGKQYLFNKQGDLVEEKDNDIGYQFDHNKVFDFCKTQNIALVIRYNKPHQLNIKKSIEPDNVTHVWIIQNPIYDKREYEFFVLDGMTGELLRSGKYPFINDGL